MSPTPAQLRWGIKASFREYIASIADGVETVQDGASVEDGVFVFPLLTVEGGDYHFGGRVDLTAYNGFLSVQVRQPRLHVSPEGWWLSVLDPGYRGPEQRRVRLCSLSERRDAGTVDLAVTEGRDARGGTTVFAARLDPAATQLFDGVYAAGTELDVVAVTLTDDVTGAST